jgi:hypothetical protein
VDPDIYRLHALFLVLIRVHQVFRVVVLSVSELKCGEKTLELMHQVIINLSAFELYHVGSFTIVCAH